MQTLGYQENPIYHSFSTWNQKKTVLKSSKLMADWINFWLWPHLPNCPKVEIRFSQIPLYLSLYIFCDCDVFRFLKQKFYTWNRILVWTARLLLKTNKLEKSEKGNSCVLNYLGYFGMWKFWCLDIPHTLESDELVDG